MEHAMQIRNFWQEILGHAGEFTFAKMPALISGNEGIKRVARQTASAALTSSTILLTGESGTGKDIFARAAHEISKRAGKNFVALNCAAITESLFESELFGYERGAFTGADRQKIGLWEEADEGTLFLDEIGDMPLTVQPKVLRAMENKKIRRVGGIRELPVDVRIIAATNQDLEQMVNERAFRRDLYYRINIVSICIPPLRQRRDDIPLLFNYFLRTISEQMGRPVPTIGGDVMEQLMGYNWPGNVRELQNVVEKALAVSLGKIELAVEDFIKPSHAPTQGMLTEMVAGFEAEVIRCMLIQTGGNQTHAAQRLGIARNVLVFKINKYKLRDLYPEIFHYRRRQ